MPHLHPLIEALRSLLFVLNANERSDFIEKAVDTTIDILGRVFDLEAMLFVYNDFDEPDLFMINVGDPVTQSNERWATCIRDGWNAILLDLPSSWLVRDMHNKIMRIDNQVKTLVEMLRSIEEPLAKALDSDAKRCPSTTAIDYVVQLYTGERAEPVEISKDIFASLVTLTDLGSGPVGIIFSDEQIDRPCGHPIWKHIRDRCIEAAVQHAEEDAAKDHGVLVVYHNNTDDVCGMFYPKTTTALLDRVGTLPLKGFQLIHFSPEVYNALVSTYKA